MNKKKHKNSSNIEFLKLVTGMGFSKIRSNKYIKLRVIAKGIIHNMGVNLDSSRNWRKIIVIKNIVQKQ